VRYVGRGKEPSFGAEVSRRIERNFNLKKWESKGAFGLKRDPRPTDDCRKNAWSGLSQGKKQKVDNEKKNLRKFFALGREKVGRKSSLEDCGIDGPDRVRGEHFCDQAGRPDAVEGERIEAAHLPLPGG